MSGIPYIPLRQSPVNGSGRPYASATLTVYRAGTTTLATVYSDSALAIPQANPVTANAAGQFPPIYLSPDYDVRCILKNAAGTTLSDDDNIPTDYIDLTATQVGTALYPATAAETAASVTPAQYQYAPGDIRRYGAVTGLENVDVTTAALQLALNANSAGRVYIPAGQWFINATVTVMGRTMVAGDGIVSELVFRPTSSGDVLFTGSGLDNITFRDFLVNGNAGTATAKTAFDFDGTNSRILWQNVYIQSIDWRGIKREDGMYDTIRDCRFINTDYSLSGSSPGRAVEYLGFANRLAIVNSRFSQNDQPVRIESGAAVMVDGCSFELEADSGNSGISSPIYFSSVRGLTFTNNYVEGCRTATSAGVVRMDDCTGVVISGNMFDGSYGGTTYSDCFLHFTGACFGVRVDNNDFREVLNHFYRISGLTQSVKAWGNNYYDGGSQVTTYNGIMAKVSGPTLLELDIPHSWTLDPASLSDGVGATVTEAVTGTLQGDAVRFSFSNDLSGITATPYVSTSGNVSVRLQNESGGPLDLTSGTARVWITKQ